MQKSKLIMKEIFKPESDIEIRQDNAGVLFGKIQINESLTFLFRETTQLINLHQLFQDYENQIGFNYSDSEVSLRRIDDHRYDLFSGMIELKISDQQCQEIKLILEKILTHQLINQTVGDILPELTDIVSLQEI